MRNVLFHKQDLVMSFQVGLSKSSDDAAGCIALRGLFVCFISALASSCCCHVGASSIAAAMEEKSEPSMYNARDCTKLLQILERKGSSYGHSSKSPRTMLSLLATVYLQFMQVRKLNLD